MNPKNTYMIQVDELAGLTRIGMDLTADELSGIAALSKMSANRFDLTILPVLTAEELDHADGDEWAEGREYAWKRVADGRWARSWGDDTPHTTAQMIEADGPITREG